MPEIQSPREIHVFVCYSHLDRKWLDGADVGLVPWLQAQLRGEGVTLWWDHGIRAGETYEKSIFERIDQAELAILLVSDDFAASEYIATKELPRIRERHTMGKLGVMPLLVAPMSQLNRKRLAWITEHIQMLPSDQRGLTSALANPVEWSELRANILDEIHHLVERMRENGGLPGESTHEKRVSDSTPAAPSEPTTLQRQPIPPAPDPRSGKESENIGSRSPTPANRSWLYALLAVTILIAGAWIGRIWQTPDTTASHRPGEPSPEAPEKPGSTEEIDENRQEMIPPVVVSSTGEFAPVPGGSYKMGDSSGKDADAPARDVSISPFYMAEYPVTLQLWRDVREWAGENGYGDLDEGTGKAPNHPVVGITWVSAVKWCNAASERDGLVPAYSSGGEIFREGKDTDPQCDWDQNGYRLPTEAEWEIAARGGETWTRFPWGNEISHTQANFRSVTTIPYDRSDNAGHHPDYRIDPKPYTSPVDAFPANSLGIFDMIGNSCEWCWDRYQSTYYQAGPTRDPRGPATGKSRVGRGGGWDGTADYCQVAKRGITRPDSSDLGLGFRLARSAEPQDAQPRRPSQVRLVAIEEVISLADFAAKNGCSVEILNEINGLDLHPSTQMAVGSELYVPSSDEE